jgi:Protein of unknown function (DUF559).
MDFDQAHAAFVEMHVQKRTGERRGRLERGHREAEKLFCERVWWPAVGNFDHLHAEYEVLDWRGIPYFCDFAWITSSVKLIIEIKGFGPHVRDMDRNKYCYELNRETFLTAMGFQVICFSYDDVAHRPELCITLLRMVLSRYQTLTAFAALASSRDKDLIRLACRLGRPLRPIDVETHFKISHRTAVRLLQACRSRGWMSGVTGKSGKHIVRYQLEPIALKQL